VPGFLGTFLATSTGKEERGTKEEKND